jgi:hypothetical protein
VCGVKIQKAMILTLDLGNQLQDYTVENSEDCNLKSHTGGFLVTSYSTKVVRTQKTTAGEAHSRDSFISHYVTYLCAPNSIRS